MLCGVGHVYKVLFIHISNGLYILPSIKAKLWPETFIKTTEICCENGTSFYVPSHRITSSYPNFWTKLLIKMVDGLLFKLSHTLYIINWAMARAYLYWYSGWMGLLPVFRFVPEHLAVCVENWKYRMYLNFVHSYCYRYMHNTRKAHWAQN